MSDAASDPQQQQLLPSGVPKRLRSELIDYDDVIAEILLRLPVKPLIRFKCVCKPWRALISDPYFVEKHFGRNKKRYNLLLPTKPFQSIDYKAMLKYFKLGHFAFLYPVIMIRNLNELLSFSHSINLQNLEFPFMKPKHSIQIYGSCNGLICVELDYVNIFLWNPYTGESKQLPKPNFIQDDEQPAWVYGFGYDSASDDYKVVRGVYECNTRNDETVIEMFSLRSGLWRELARLELTLRGQGCLLNEALHWIRADWKDWKMVGSTIVRLHLAEDKLQEMPAQCPNPIANSDGFYNSMGIGVIGNCLSVCLEEFDRDLSIWVMKEYGVKESWTQVVSIPREALHMEALCKDHGLKFRPLSISENGEVFMYLDTNVLALYSPKDKRFKTVLETHWDCRFDTTTYVESLVSPVTGQVTELTWEQRMDLHTSINSNSNKLLLPGRYVYSVGLETLLESLTEADVRLASSRFDYPVLIRPLSDITYGQITSRELDCPVMAKKCNFQIYGSCNGLICLEVDYENIILWNPCTGESNLLPKATQFYDDQYARFYGFGYDSIHKDYKIVRGCYDLKLETMEDDTIFEVFTLKTGSWRQDLSLVTESGPLWQGCLVNESLHWLDHEYDEDGYINNLKILSFVLGEEKFQQLVPMPNPLPGNGFYHSVEVGAIGDCLCLCFEPIGSDLSIWMMEEYGVKDSWAEVIEIPRVVLIKEFGFYFKPLCIFENGELLLCLHRNVWALYNRISKTFRTVVETHDDQSLNTAIYVETLVSPTTDRPVV